MRKIGKVASLTLGAAMVAGCSGGEDFAVDVQAPAQAVHAALGDLHSSSLPSMLNLSAADKSSPEPGQILYSIPARGKSNPATILFDVDELKPARSRITVSVDIPAVKVSVNEIVSEDKVEQYLEEELRAWAVTRSKGQSGLLEIDAMQSSMGSLAVALQYAGDLNALANGDVPIGFGSFGSSEMDSDYGGSDYASNDTGPMTDPSQDAENYGAPTDDGDPSTSEYDTYESDDGGWGNSG